MKITLELYASLMKFLPPDSSMHATELEIADDFTPNNLIDQFEIPREQAHIVLVNGGFKDGDARDEPCFKEGDKMAIWPPVAGG